MFILVVFKYIEFELIKEQYTGTLNTLHSIGTENIITLQVACLFVKICRISVYLYVYFNSKITCKRNDKLLVSYNGYCLLSKKFYF